MRKKIKKSLLQAISNLAKAEVNVNQENNFPFPPCMGIFYQPKRPKKKDD
ncbi:MAG: cyclic lactone autoinducer peptide [Lachnospiraceae bacterium]|nr:cyclic lactone autoinducer peptide [Lachnospiraceae bacterium]